MKNLRISTGVLGKLESKHRVTRREIEQCFENKCGIYLVDDREDHKSDPSTLWFLAPTNHNRLLKVVFVFRDGNINLRTAYEPNAQEICIYDAQAK